MLSMRPAGTNRRYCFILAASLLFVFSLMSCWRGSRSRPTSTPVHTTSAPASTNSPVVSGTLKIAVSQEGLFTISGADIIKSMPGWENVDPAHLRLTLRGQEQPVWISAQGQDFQITFYGQASDSRYTGENIYLLSGSADAPLSMGEKQLPDIAGSPVESFLSTVHFEENHLYSPLALDGDHLFWSSLAGRKKQEFEIDLPKMAAGGGSLRVAVWGSTESPEQFDHHVVISLNGQILVDEKWDGSGRRTLEASFPAGLLTKGTNKVLVEAPGDTGAAAEINYIDWIEFRYPRQAEADHDFLSFELFDEASEAPLHIRGFSTPVVIADVTVLTETYRITGEFGPGDFVFRGEAGHRYLAVGQEGFSSPASLSPVVMAPDLRAPGSGADYVAIGAEDLLRSLSPLLERRSSQGLRVKSIPLEAVYDQFNEGMPEPQSIHKFMVYASKVWDPAPRYLLLIGDATYDPRGYVSAAEANRLPVMYIQTHFGGETASDVLFGDVNGDQRPELAVGRMPAQTPEQVRILVDKTIAYEKAAAGQDWRTRILAISDGQDASFKGDAQAFLDSMAAPYTGTLYATEAGVKDAAAVVKRYFDEGYGVIAYFGHGSINMWGKDRIFMAEDVSSLSNPDRLPVVVNMTCLTGLFINPKVTSLMETLLWYDKGGAVAMLAPTSLTLQSSQSYLSKALVEAITQTADARLGDIFLQAQQKVPVDDMGTREVLLTFLLFGDPALQFGEK
jgi:Peptidase family C25